MGNPKNTYIIIFGGPNGSGKTTLNDVYKEAGLKVDIYINADEIAQEILSSNTENLTQPEIDVKASRDAQDRLVHHMKSKEAEVVVYETVMSHISKVEYLERANELGLETRLMFISTSDAEINASRVEARVKSGGHPVPRDKILSRYHRTVTQMMPKAILIAKKSRIYDNSEERELPQFVARIDNTENTVHILNNPPEWVMVNALQVLAAQDKYQFKFCDSIEPKLQKNILDRLGATGVGNRIEKLINDTIVSHNELIEASEELSKLSKEDRASGMKEFVLAKKFKGEPNKAMTINLRLLAMSKILKSDQLTGWARELDSNESHFVSEPVWDAAANEPLLFSKEEAYFDADKFLHRLITTVETEGKA